MPNILDAVGKQFVFLELESHTVFHENITNTFKQTKKTSEDSSPQKDVINDDTAAKVRGISGITRAVKGLPFAFENPHHTCVKSRSITRAKRHHRPTIFVIIGRKESKFLLILESDTNLVVASLIVESDEEQAASRIAEVINSVIATRNGVLERQSDLVETAVRDAQAPDKVTDIDNVFLVRFGSEDDGGAPRSKTFTDPAIDFQNLEVFHDDLAFVRPVMRFLATDGRRGASVDSNFEVQNRELDASTIEAVPIRLDDVDNCLASHKGNSVKAEDKVLREFG
jgi:hypothetical protein